MARLMNAPLCDVCTGGAFSSLSGMFFSLRRKRGAESQHSVVHVAFTSILGQTGFTSAPGT